MKNLPAILLLAAAFPLSAADWPMHRGGPQMLGRTTDAAPSVPSVAWTFKAPDPKAQPGDKPRKISITAPAAVVAGTVYVGDSAGVLHALDAATGKPRWTFPTEAPIEAAPLVLDGVVYQGSGDGKLYALDAATGAKRWAYSTDDKILGGANFTRTPSLRILIGSYDTNLHCVDAATGNRVWTVTTENYINGAPAVTAAGEIVFGGCDAFIRIVASADGKELRKIESGAYVPGSIAVDGAQGFTGTYGNNVLGLDLAGGKIQWTYKDRAFPFFASPALTADNLIIGGRDKRLHCLSRKTGEAKWIFQTKGEVDSSPVICGDGVVFGSGDGRLYCVALADGKERWNLDLGAAITASPAIADSAIYIGTENGELVKIAEKK